MELFTERHAEKIVEEKNHWVKTFATKPLNFGFLYKNPSHPPLSKGGGRGRFSAGAWSKKGRARF
jgi:hypothetical protein